MTRSDKKIYCVLRSAVALGLVLLILAGCGGKAAAFGFGKKGKGMGEEEAAEIYARAVEAAKGRDSVPEAYRTECPGEKEERNEKGFIDYSRTEDGYVTVCFTAATQSKIKAQVKGPESTYTYAVAPGGENVLPLTEGNGSYTVTLLENVGDTRYAVFVSASFEAKIRDEFSPFLRSNRYVNYADAPVTSAVAEILTDGLTDPMDCVKMVFEFVLARLEYDKVQAATVQDGYVPDLDDVLERQTGICFDYASLMTAMLRSRGIPCRLVVGYAANAYHAWINVWSEEEGWIDKVVYFDGHGWQRMDPTFSDANVSDKTLKEYIGDGSNYTPKYYY